MLLMPVHCILGVILGFGVFGWNSYKGQVTNTSTFLYLHTKIKHFFTQCFTSD